jgi:nucleotide-binding universal stress UspA family protein
MKRYLVAYEGSPHSEAALSHALNFAKAVPGNIEIIYVADERALANPVADFTVLTLQGLGTLGDFLPLEKAKLELKAKLIARGEEIIDGLRKRPGLEQEAGGQSTITTRVEFGNPVKYMSEISEIYDVIFMGLWGEMHKFKAGLWGSTSESVIRKGASPVFLATKEFAPLTAIVAAFDNRPRSRQALAWAGVLGESMKLPVHVISSGNDEEWREKTISEAKVITESYDTQFTYNALDERAADAIIRESEIMPDALVCIGAFGDQPLRELFLGSVAEEVLRRAKSAVMLFK